MAVYIFERIEIIKGGRGKFIDLVRRRWAPQNEAKHGVHLAGLWATAGSTADWPEANVMWEYRDWTHFAEASQAQYPREDKDPFLNELWRQAVDWRSGGVSDLLVPSSFSPDRAERQAKGIDGPLVQVERIKTKKGKMSEYHAAIESELVPLAESRGMQLMGAYRHAIRPNEGLNLWFLSSWDQARDIWESDLTDPEVARWRQRSGDLLENIRGHIIVTPPEGALRT